MLFSDIVEFEFNFKEYGFSNLFVIGKDIFEYTHPVKKPGMPAIIKSSDTEKIRRNLKTFNIIYLPSYEANVALISAAAKKGKMFEIVIRDILSKEGIERARMIYRIRRFIQFCFSYGAPILLTSRARNIYEVRTPKEMEEIGKLLGLTAHQARFAIPMANIREIIEER